MIQQMENPMRTPVITKVTLSAGGKEKELEKSAKLLEKISGMKAQIIRTGPNRRIPAFDVKPNMEVGVRVTLRRKEGEELLRRLLGAVDNRLKRRQVSVDTFSFGIKEYIEIPGIEYMREIGIKGLNVTITFERKGLRVKIRKIKRGKIPVRQHVTKEEIIKYMEDKYKTEFI